jgi:hypothetical protein
MVKKISRLLLQKPTGSFIGWLFCALLPYGFHTLTQDHIVKSKDSKFIVKWKDSKLTAHIQTGIL